MKKVGIITLYHNNVNYGGLLQAYALAKYVESMECSVEQICTDFIREDDNKLLVPGLGIRRKIKRVIQILIYKKNRKCFQARKKEFKQFEKMIPHSEMIYNHETIKDTLNRYDLFITGSDQVWNMTWFQTEYFLAFVKDKKKVSYAASMPGKIEEKHREQIKNYLSDFDNISVREESTVSILSELTGKKVQQVLDPTLLFGKEEWSLVCDDSLQETRYVFCYFLSNDAKIRKMSQKFAKYKKLKIVTLPHVGSINLSDCFFGDRKLYDVSPAHFISLIKNADYVLTDSFHATIFSIIFETKYLVFSRGDWIHMNTRLASLLGLFDEQARLINSQIDIREMNTIADKRQNVMTEKYQKMLMISKSYLNDCL